MVIGRRGAGESQLVETLGRQLTLLLVTGNISIASPALLYLVLAPPTLRRGRITWTLKVIVIRGHGYNTALIRPVVPAGTTAKTS